jgi:uncharacterized membrane protein
MSPPATTTPATPGRRGSVAPRSFRGRIVAGLLLIVPLAVTVFLIRYIYDAALWVGVKLVYVISQGFWWAGVSDAPRKIDLIDAKWYEKGIAVVLTVVMLYLVGWLGTNVVGRRIIELFEHLFERIPLVDTVYGSIKRMVQALSGAGKGDGTQRVVLVDFPHENMKTIAFVTNSITDLTSGRKMLAVYVPTTPNPTSGYMEFVPEDKITYTDWTMDQAMSMILSGGATAPSEVHLSPAKPTAGKS